MKKFIFISMLFAVNGAFAGNIDSYRSYFNALLLEKGGSYEKALEEYRKAISIDPDPYLYKSAMKLAMVLGDVPSTLEYARVVVEKDSSSAESWYDYGNALWAANKKMEAEKAFQEALKVNPDYAEAYYQLASLNPREVNRAMYYLNRLIAIRPDLKADAYMRAAEIYFNNKDIKKAEEYLKKSAAEDEFYTRPRYMLAVYYEDLGDWKSAIKMYEEIAKAEPGNPEPLNKIGEIYLTSLKDYSMAEKYFLSAHNASELNPQALYWLSALSEMKKDFKKAEFYSKKLQESSPSAANAVKLGYYRSMEGDIKGAMEVLSSAFSKWPDNAELAYFLALGYDDLKDDLKSREYLEKAIKLNPDYSDARMQLAVVCEKLNDITCFRENFSKVIEKDPKNHIAMNYLGYSLADRGLELNYAEELVKKALALDPENAAYLDSLAWIKHKEGDNEQALKNIELSLSGYPQDPVVQLHAGEIYMALGLYNKAWESFALSNLMKPDKKTLKRSAAAAKKADFPSAFPEFLKKNYFAASAFSLPCSARLKIAGKKISMDCHISSKENGDFYLFFYDPMMAPSFYFSFEGGEWKISIPSLETNSYVAESYAREIAPVLKLVFSKELSDLPASAWRKGYFEKDGTRFYLNKEKDFFKKIKTASGLKLYLERFYTSGRLRVSKALLKFYGGELSISVPNGEK
ncbi:MAG: hypothetical protein Fur0012_04450 [Elusimicrobiota bacterium]